MFKPSIYNFADDPTLELHCETRFNVMTRQLIHGDRVISIGEVESQLLWQLSFRFMEWMSIVQLGRKIERSDSHILIAMRRLESKLEPTPLIIWRRNERIHQPTQFKLSPR